tara:strand:- start:13 stop:651 length:639 start_codon:yes stop_codon:yes gene_type:complete
MDKYTKTINALKKEYKQLKTSNDHNKTNNNKLITKDAKIVNKVFELKGGNENEKQGLKFDKIHDYITFGSVKVSSYMWDTIESKTIIDLSDITMEDIYLYIDFNSDSQYTTSVMEKRQSPKQLTNIDLNNDPSKELYKSYINNFTNLIKTIYERDYTTKYKSINKEDLPLEYGGSNMWRGIVDEKRIYITPFLSVLKLAGETRDTKQEINII